MEHVEHTTTTTFHTPPSLWLRIVDGTFCILNKDHINDIHLHLNSICSHIQFTIEKAHNFLFPFLTFWLNVIVAMVTPSLADFYLPEFTENPYTPIDIFIIRHIIPNIRSSLRLKLYSAGLTKQIKNRSTVNYRTYIVPCDLTGFLPEPRF